MPLETGQMALGTVSLRLSTKTGAIRAHLRWRDSGRTVSRSLGVVERPNRSANLAEGWAKARSLGLVQDEVLPSESWASSREARASMRGNRGRDTNPELQLRSELHGRGFRYRVSVRPLPGLRRTADIVFTKERLAIFVDGCFWHGCEKHHRPAKKNSEFWQKKIADNKRRDSETNQLLSNQGWTVIRCWEHEDPKEVASRIVTALRRSEVSS
ncbi:very short patch repair endonuclease [Amycolatopsis speibonae]|uniref:Very short patch repair endonuclease n=1 Tax=Amycolatopsis speibonae TaxID=1450224 RepID=A0ABV7NRY8_9PSEU